ncbi:MAG: hypothetical protein K2Z81_12630, partial [Cyanobacteria bacterium]|nr:hypothetical protein [Cyanobacteriota bacterium]
DRVVYLKGWSEMGVAALAMIAVFMSYSHGFLGRFHVSRRTSVIAWLSVLTLYSAFVYQSGVFQATLPTVINVIVVLTVAAAAFLMGERVCTSLSMTTDPLKFYQASLIGLVPAVILLSPAASVSLFLTLATCLSVPLLTGYLVSSKLIPSSKRSAALFSITSIAPLTVCLPLLFASLLVTVTFDTPDMTRFTSVFGNVLSSSFLWTIIFIAIGAYPAAVSGGLIGYAATPARRNIGVANPEDDCSASRVAKLRG